MKQIFIALLCCLLLFAGINAAAQEITAPLPPPENGTSPLPPPESGSSALPNVGAQAPARSGGSAASRAPAAAATSRRDPSDSVREFFGGSASSSSSSAVSRRAPADSGSAAQETISRRAPADSGSAAAVSRRAPADSGSAAQAAAPQSAESSAQTGIPSTGTYWGVMAGGGFTGLSGDVNQNNGYSAHFSDGGNFDAGILLGRDYGLLAYQVEFLFTSENFEYSYSQSSPNYTYNRYEFNATVIRIPLLIKLDFHFGRFMLQPLGGLYFNFGLGDLDYDQKEGGMNSGTTAYINPMLGMMVGGAVGFRIGRGYIFADFRYVGDLGDMVIDSGVTGSELSQKRSGFMGNFGYQRYF